jgi:hypothetical protein
MIRECGRQGGARRPYLPPVLLDLPGRHFAGAVRAVLEESAKGSITVYEKGVPCGRRSWPVAMAEADREVAS